MTAFAIKMIAITSMLIDHAGAVFDLHEYTRVIGRIAFPLFVFLIAEGCRHTKNMKKYLLRLGVFALISEIPFDLAFNDRIDFFNNTNIFYTLFLGVFCVYIWRCIESTNLHELLKRLLIGFSAIIIGFLAVFLSSDYGAMGVFFILIIAMTHDGGSKYWQLAVMAVFCILLYYTRPILLAGSLISLPIVALYNWEQGRPVKWPFYWFYPGHLLLFALIAKL